VILDRRGVGRVLRHSRSGGFGGGGFGVCSDRWLCDAWVCVSETLSDVVVVSRFWAVGCALLL